MWCELRVVNITTEVIRKYAINTVMIAHLGTNHKTIQVNIPSVSVRMVLKSA